MIMPSITVNPTQFSQKYKLFPLQPEAKGERSLSILRIVMRENVALADAWDYTIWMLELPITYKVVANS
jgi:hypothetical protein